MRVPRRPEQLRVARFRHRRRPANGDHSSDRASIRSVPESIRYSPSRPSAAETPSKNVEHPRMCKLRVVLHCLVCKIMNSKDISFRYYFRCMTTTWILNVHEHPSLSSIRTRSAPDNYSCVNHELSPDFPSRLREDPPGAGASGSTVFPPFPPEFSSRRSQTSSGFALPAGFSSDAVRIPIRPTPSR